MIWASSIKILVSTCLKMFPLLLPRIAQVWAYYLAIRVGRHLHKGLTPQPLQLVRIQTFELNGWTIQPLIPWSPGSFTRLDSQGSFLMRGCWSCELWGNFWHPSCLVTQHSVITFLKVSKDHCRLAKRLQKTWNIAKSSNSFVTDSWDCSKYRESKYPIQHIIKDQRSTWKDNEIAWNIYLHFFLKPYPPWN